jgi:nitric oxide reductase large subunit
MQGLNATATHAHAALFEVYGMLGLGLILSVYVTNGPGTLEHPLALDQLLVPEHWHRE